VAIGWSHLFQVSETDWSAIRPVEHRTKPPGPDHRARRLISFDRLGLLEGFLVVLDDLDREVAGGGVTRCRVDLDLLAGDRLGRRDRDALAAEHGLGHALAGAVGLGDRGQDDLDGSDTVERVATLRILAV